MMNEQEQKEFAMKAGQNLCNELSKRGVIMSDDEMKHYRRYEKLLSHLKNNRDAIKKCGDLLKESSNYIDKVIQIYEDPLRFDPLTSCKKIDDYMTTSLQCVELAAKGISALTIYNDINVQIIKNDTEEEQ